MSAQTLCLELKDSLSAFSARAMENSTLSHKQREFTYSWLHLIDAVLPYITMFFRVYVPPTMAEIQALRTNTHALIKQNRPL